MTEGRRRFLWSLWPLTLVLLMLSSHGDDDAYSYGVSLLRTVGVLSAVQLVAAMAIKAVSRWVREATKLRRALGLAAAACAVLHASIAVASSPLTFAEQLDEPHLRFGFGALIVLVLMALTSFPRVVVWLHLRSWKELHRLVYVAWLCVVLHVLLSAYEANFLVLFMIVVVCVASLGRLVPRLPARNKTSA